MSTLPGGPGSLWGGMGGGGNSSGTAGVPLGTGLIMPAYRIAGLVMRAMIVPSPDMYAEAVPALNRLMGSWNLDGHKIFGTAITEFPLTADQKIYTIGPGAELDAPRPLYIRGANIILPTTPQVRRPVRILDDDEWRRIAVQDVAGAPPYQLYYDGSYDDNGYGKVYLRFQAPAGYLLELYTWQGLKKDFTDQSDIAVFPDGYERPIVYTLAEELAAMDPERANMTTDAHRIAAQARQALIISNSRSPKMDAESGMGGCDWGSGYGWLDGGIR